MKEFWSTIQLVLAAIGGWLGWFLGGCDGLLYALIAFVVVDYITGIMCAVVDKKLSSAVGFRGIFKKVLIFTLVGIANILDVNVIGSGSVLRTAIIFFYISNEGVSLLENAGHLGLPIPAKLKAVLEQLHDRVVGVFSGDGQHPLIGAFGSVKVQINIGHPAVRRGNGQAAHRANCVVEHRVKDQRSGQCGDHLRRAVQIDVGQILVVGSSGFV